MIRSRFSIPIATALVGSLRGGYGFKQLRGDLLAGITVGIVAVPLAMALAIAVGVPPQHGLYTSIIAGVVIAFTGGSRFSITGPTAAFVVILLPITQQYGLGGLLVTTIMAGVILLVMGVTRLGRLIQFIPYPVTAGFTAGIAVVIATLQIKDLLGLPITGMPAHYVEKLAAIYSALPGAHLPDLAIGIFTLTILLLWPRLKTAIPGYLVALLVASVAAAACGHYFAAFKLETIGSRFSYDIASVIGHGIPPLPPHFVLPWHLPDAQGVPIVISWDLISALIPAAFTVAMLGAIESLLCAVVADGLTSTKHDPDAELVGQGLGNIIVPFFGGITATSAIARTATSIRAGAVSPLAAVIHSGVVLLVVVLLSRWMGYIPMATLAAILVIVAWNLSEARHFVNIVRVAPGSDVAVLLTCFGLTVFFDMVLAVGIGVVLASLLFIRRMSEMTGATELDETDHEHLKDLPAHIAVYAIEGPMFFGAAEKAVSVLHRFNREVKVIIIDMSSVPMIDMSGIVALDSTIKRMNADGVAVVVCSLLPRIYHKLLRAGLRKKPGQLAFATDLQKARGIALRISQASDISMQGIPG